MILEIGSTLAPTPLQSALFDGPLAGELFLLGRLLFGVVLAFMGLNHFLNVGEMAGYAEMKGIPAPKAAVTVSGGALIFGGLGIAAGFLPAIAAGVLIAFFAVVTPTMHDFWAVPEDQQQTEMTNFLKNLALLGAALVLFALSPVAWPYAVNVTLF